MLKIESLSSENLSFKSGVLCLHWYPSRLNPVPTFGALKQYEHGVDTFSYAFFCM